MSRPKTRQLKELQAYGAKKARELGITSEDDVDRLVHEYRAELSTEIYTENEIKNLLAEDKVGGKARRRVPKRTDAIKHTPIFARGIDSGPRFPFWGQPLYFGFDWRQEPQPATVPQADVPSANSAPPRAIMGIE